MFDWATQPVYTLVVTFIFAPYFVNGFMHEPILGAALWGYATGIAQLIAALLAPILGARSDALGHRRKPWIAGFSVLLMLGLCGLWFAYPMQTQYAPLVLVSFGLALIGTELATVFTNAMMPGLIGTRRLGTLSGTGWAIGYVGGIFSLALVAGLLVSDADTGKTLLGLEPLFPLDVASREGDRLVGPFSAVWYLVFALPLFLFTPDLPADASITPAGKGLGGLVRGLKRLYAEHRQVFLFLAARMLYADGLGAIFAFGGIYAGTIFGWGPTELGLFGIILAITAAIGAGLGGLMDDALGSKPVIVLMLIVLIIGAIGVLSVDQDEILFFVPVAERIPDSPALSSTGERVYLLFAAMIGFASGPVQAASRTLLAHLTPPEKTTEFFGFFAFSGKASAFAAPLMIGAVTALAGSQRIGISTALVFLIGGLVLLQFVRMERSAKP
ncbi:MFS transporter [Methyloligella sp. GL2]|nr:MFS transporter [Methyloligella sp. GL2]